MNPPGQNLRELIGGREWLFADDSYHIDVSHLNAVVRFARFLDAGSPELDLALQLAQYGSRLAQQYQYAGNPPFDDFYPAHIQFFKALLGDDREQALAYFRSRIGDDVADTDNQMAAYVLVDLLLATRAARRGARTGLPVPGRIGRRIRPVASRAVCRVRASRSLARLWRGKRGTSSTSPRPSSETARRDRLRHEPDGVGPHGGRRQPLCPRRHRRRMPQPLADSRRSRLVARQRRTDWTSCAWLPAEAGSRSSMPRRAPASPSST